MKAAFCFMLGTMVAGCAPQPGAVVVPVKGESSVATGADCSRLGGVLKPVGRLQTIQCVITYSDAGKSCKSGKECQGDCRAPTGAEVLPGQRSAGLCQATSDQFGCNTRIEDGRAEATLCID